MKFMSAREVANKWGISQRRVAILCSENRIAEATKVGNMWIISANAQKPIDARTKRN
jgi:DNA adenine methylase